jgi:hypothetical protein
MCRSRAREVMAEAFSAACGVEEVFAVQVEAAPGRPQRWRRRRRVEVAEPACTGGGGGWCRGVARWACLRCSFSSQTNTFMGLLGLISAIESESFIGFILLPLS